VFGQPDYGNRKGSLLAVLREIRRVTAVVAAKTVLGTDLKRPYVCGGVALSG
jgi:hypothetical protein